MTCRIDRLSIAQGIVLRISGRIAAEDVDLLRAALTDGSVIVLDLTELELVDRDAVRLLSRSEARGIELRNCPTYIREWVTREGKSS